MIPTVCILFIFKDFIICVGWVFWPHLDAKYQNIHHISWENLRFEVYVFVSHNRVSLSMMDDIPSSHTKQFEADVSGWYTFQNTLDLTSIPLCCITPQMSWVYIIRLYGSWRIEMATPPTIAIPDSPYHDRHNISISVMYLGVFFLRWGIDQFIANLGNGVLPVFLRELMLMATVVLSLCVKYTTVESVWERVFHHLTGNVLGICPSSRG